MPASFNPTITIYRRNIFCLIILILLCGFIIGWTDTWESLQRESEKIRSLHADFIQRKNLEILSEPLISKGEFFFKSPDSLRFEYTTPVRSITLVHENNYKSYTHGDEGLTRDSEAQLSVMRYVIDEISLWLQGKFKKSSNFEATLKPENKIILTPKNKAIESTIEYIELYLSRRPGLLNKVIIFENKKSHTEIIFKNATINCSLNDSIFQTVNSTQ